VARHELTCTTGRRQTSQSGSLLSIDAWMCETAAARRGLVRSLSDNTTLLQAADGNIYGADESAATERPFGRSKAHSPAHYDWLASCVNNRITGSVRHILESALRRLVANSPQRRVDLAT